MNLALLVIWCLLLITVQSDEEFRLVGGPCPNEGRVERFYEGEWGTVCDTGFGGNEAKVACRYFGYSNGTLGGFYGNGSGIAVMEQVNCTGYEASLENCEFTVVLLDQFKCLDGGAATVTCDFETGCPVLSEPSHGTISSLAASHGTQVTVSCDDNYTLFGSSNLSCHCGSWSDEVGQCKADCPRITAPVHGSLSSDAVSDGTLLTVRCDDTYTLVGDSSIGCHNGSWSGEVGTCEADCPPLTAPLHGTLSTSDVIHGTLVKVSCTIGRSLSGDTDLQCQSGSWSGEVGICGADCPTLSPPQHGNLSSTSNSHGTVVWVSCEAGYSLTGNSVGSLYCQAGSWSTEVGICEPDCPKLSVPSHGSLTSLESAHGTQVILYCNTGYTSTGSHSPVTCVSGDWSGDIGTCEEESPIDLLLLVIIVAATAGVIIILLIALLVFLCIWVNREQYNKSEGTVRKGSFTGSETRPKHVYENPGY